MSKKLFITASNQGNVGKSTISNIFVDYLRNVLKEPTAVYLADAGKQQDRLLTMHGTKNSNGDLDETQDSINGVEILDFLCKNSPSEIETEKKEYAQTIQQSFVESVMSLPDDSYIYIDLPQLSELKDLYEYTFETRDNFFSVLFNVLELDVFFIMPLSHIKSLAGIEKFYSESKDYPVQYIIVKNEFGADLNIDNQWTKTDTFKGMMKKGYYEINMPMFDEKSIDMLKDNAYSFYLDGNAPELNKSNPKKSVMSSPYSINAFMTVKNIFHGKTMKGALGTITKHPMQDIANIIQAI